MYIFSLLKWNGNLAKLSLLDTACFLHLNEVFSQICAAYVEGAMPQITASCWFCALKIGILISIIAQAKKLSSINHPLYGNPGQRNRTLTEQTDGD